MKRRITVILLLVLLALIMGCSRNAAVDTEENTDLIVVGFSQVGAESNWRVANTASMKEALSESEGFELIFDNAKQKQENQIKAIRTFIQQGVDYIVLAPITETGWESVLEEARVSGIPVILVDRQIDVQDQSLYTAWVGSDFRREADVAMEWLSRELIKKGLDTEPVNILHIQGTAGASAQIGRTAGLEAAVRAHPNWTIAAQLPGEYTQAKAYEAAKKYLTEHRDIDVVYSENDDMAFGVMEVMDELHIPYGAKGGVIVISFDAVHTALEACLAGKINLCVECNPLHGPRVAQLIRQIEGGELSQKKIYVEERSFSTDTLTEDVLSQRMY